MLVELALTSLWELNAEGGVRDHYADVCGVLVGEALSGLLGYYTDPH